MTDLRTLIAHYREIEQAATPGPWFGTDCESVITGDGDRIAANDCMAADHVDSTDDMRAIAAARNLFAALLDVAEAADERLDAGSDCDCDDGECSCGHAALSFTVRRLREAMEASRG